jgi:subtilisin family serine protease
MTPLIEEQLRATGTAQVIVVLQAPPAPQVSTKGLEAGADMMPAAAAPSLEAVADSLSPLFVSSALSQDSALATDRPARVRRNAVRGRPRGMASDAALPPEETPLPPKMRLFKNLGLILGTTDREGVAALNTDQRVRSVTAAPQISPIRPVVSSPARLAGAVTWGLERLGVPDLWDAGFTGKGVLVGHLDTGVDGKHQALKGAVAEFAEFDLMGDKVDGARPHDSGEHGTHTAGTILGRKIRATAFGMAPGARLASAMVIEGGNVVARILGGMDWVVGLGVKVLSMSLGLRGYHEDFLPVTGILRDRGVLPVFAVGNEYAGTSRSPGNYVEALSVGACDENDEVADFSSSQRFARERDPIVPDLVAPGVGVISSVPGEKFKQMDGTSMATPHVAGLAALLWQAKPEATPDEIEAAIFASCQRPADMLEERGNRGIPNGPRALAALLGTDLPLTAAKKKKPRKPATTKQSRRLPKRPKRRTAKAR